MNYYELLGVNPDSSKMEIDSAYESIVGQLSASSGSIIREENSAEDKIRQIKVAYSVLSVDWKRSEYDELLKSLGAFNIENNKAPVKDGEKPTIKEKEDQEKLQKIYGMMFLKADARPPKYILKTIAMSILLLAALYILNYEPAEKNQQLETGLEPPVTAEIEQVVAANQDPKPKAEIEPTETIEPEVPEPSEVKPPETSIPEVQDSIGVNPPATDEAEPSLETKEEPALEAEVENTIKPWEYQVGYSCVFDDFSASERIAPFTISTADTDIDYFVKLEDSITSKTVLTFYIIGGETFESKVPIGNYVMKYATGYEWYGTEHLFGPDTQYYTSDDIFEFSEDGGVVNGWTIELIKRQGGNLASYTIDPSEW